jgi:diphosphomevalonate decarboxylase
MSSAFKPAAAYAHTNIALIKYWGKRVTAGDPEGRLNLPATGSLSLTLDRFGTRSALQAIEGPVDRLLLDGEEADPRATGRVSRFLDLAREASGEKTRVLVTSVNDVPTAAGLASSASAFAALAVAANEAFSLGLDPAACSALARQGSGSAARSIFGGLVLMHRGERDDGMDSTAEPLTTPDGLDLRLLVVRCAAGPKDVPSTDGMKHTEQTSPYFAPWVQTHAADLEQAQTAIAAADLERLGEVMEHSTLKMHASAMGARPGFWYFAPTTVAAMNKVRALKKDGARCWLTMDAGPHVKVLCPPAEAEALAAELRAVEGVHGVEIAAPGPAARVVDA